MLRGENTPSDTSETFHPHSSGYNDTQGISEIKNFNNSQTDSNDRCHVRTYVAEAAGKNKNKRIWIETAYKNEGREVHHGENTLSKTSETSHPYPSGYNDTLGISEVKNFNNSQTDSNGKGGNDKGNSCGNPLPLSIGAHPSEAVLTQALLTLSDGPWVSRTAQCRFSICIRRPFSQTAHAADRRCGGKTENRSLKTAENATLRYIGCIL